jgi:putative flippase GtrA
MRTFVKAQAASLIASLTDFSVSIFLAKLLGWWYLLASVTGTIVGGIAHFTISRSWVFDAREKQVGTQAIKYILVWVGSLSLNALGVFLITHYLGENFVVSKIVVSIIIGIFYNYLLQKKIVFKKN